MSILITSAMSAKAHSFKSNLNSTDIILGDYHDVPEFMLSATLIKLPDPTTSPSYAHQMLALSLDNAVTDIYVLDHKEAVQLTEARQLFAEYGIQIKTDDV